MTTIYVAGASSEAAEVSGYIARLAEAGVRCTYDWTKDVRAAKTSDALLPDDVRFRLTERDLMGVYDAEWFWLVMPRGTSVGAFIEYGFALAMDKRTVVSGAYERTIFSSHAEHRFPTHESALDFLSRDLAEAAQVTARHR